MLLFTIVLAEKKGSIVCLMNPGGSVQPTQSINRPLSWLMIRSQFDLTLEEERDQEKERGEERRSQTDGELNRFGGETRRGPRERPKDEIKKHKQFTKVEGAATTLAAVVMGSMYFWCVEDVIQDPTLWFVFRIHSIVRSETTTAIRGRKMGEQGKRNKPRRLNVAMGQESHDVGAGEVPKDDLF